MNSNNSNTIIKTIIFILVVGLSCLVFFGLNEDKKTDMELIAFGFLMFAELVTYISALIPSLKILKKVESSDIVSCGILYLITSIVINCVCFSSIDSVRYLVIVNIIVIIVYIILFCLTLLRKKEK